MRHTVYLTFLIVLVGILMIGCEKEAENKSSEETKYKALAINKLDQKTITEKDLSTFLQKVLSLNEIKNIKIINDTNCEIIFRNNTTCKFSNSDKTVTLDLEGNMYKLSFYEDKFIVENLTTNRKTEYNKIEGITQNIDKAITVSIAVLLYKEEFENYNYEEIQPILYDVGTHVCIHVRKSYCNKEHAMELMTKHCGHKPTTVLETDCGCLWGDFLCICITDFEC